MKLEDMTFEYEYADESDISYRVLKKLNSLGLRPIRVPIRKTGLSSQGDYLQCHVNVKKMVNRYGGKRLVGHTVGMHDKDTFETYAHSVWITPENKVVDICKKNWSNKDDFNYDKDYLIFIPRKIDEKPDSYEHEEVIPTDFIVHKNKMIAVSPFNENDYIYATTLKNSQQILEAGVRHYLCKMKKKNIFLERTPLNLIKKYFRLVKNEGITAWSKV
mgnify:FL=1